MPINLESDQPPARQRRRVLFVGVGPWPAAGSRAAPGIANRLWQFLQPALAAGHDCLAFTIQPDAPGGAAQIPIYVKHAWRDKPWREVPLRPFHCYHPETLKPFIDDFAPDAVVGAGTLLAASTACAIAGERPVWADFFGDPLAEIEAKAEHLGPAATRDEHLGVWRLMLRVLMRGDAFSTVSRRQADALLGQLALVGRLGLLQDELIQPMPCALESMNVFGAMPDAAVSDRAGLLARAGLPENALIALWSGGFNAWADTATLVEGVEHAMDRDERLHLVSTGGNLPGYLARVYEKFQARLAGSRHAARLHALGWLPREEAESWLRAADVALVVDRLCAETRLGGRNRLLYHAAARCAVLASRGAEVVDEMEAAHALEVFPSANPDALALALSRLLASAELRETLGRNSMVFAQRRYTFDVLAGPFLAFLDAPGRRPAPAASAPEAIARYLDIDAHDAHWAELTRLRQGLRGRLKRFIGGNPK